MTVWIALCMFLPFMPGDFDSLAAPISTSAQLLSFGSLLFVPLGIAWLINEIMRHRKMTAKSLNAYYFMSTGLIILFVFTLVICLNLFLSGDRLLVLFILIFGIYFFVKVRIRIKRQRNTISQKFNLLPICLICAPLLLFFVRFMFIDRAVEYGRDRAIKQSEKLIQDIETFRHNNGHYPISILALHHDYKPSVAGIKKYNYEPNGDAYNLYFEQLSGNLGTIEVVMYNPFGKQVMTSHDQDLLLLSANELNQQRGYYAVRNMQNSNWKIFLFD